MYWISVQKWSPVSDASSYVAIYHNDDCGAGDTKRQNTHTYTTKPTELCESAQEDMRGIYSNE